MRISDWSSDVCSSDLCALVLQRRRQAFQAVVQPPPLRSTNAPVAGRLIVQHIDGKHRAIGRDSAHDGLVEQPQVLPEPERSEEHTSELQSLMRISYAVFCLKKNKTQILNMQHKEPDEDIS